MKNLILFLFATITFCSCSSDSSKLDISENLFNEKVNSFPFLEENIVKKVDTVSIQTRSGLSIEKLIFKNEQEEQSVPVYVSTDEKGFYSIMLDESEPPIFHFSINQENDDTFIVSTYDKNKVLRNISRVTNNGNRYLEETLQVFTDESRGWFGSDSKETVSECYERHMYKDKTGGIITTIYQRTMGFAGVVIAHTAGYLSCYIYRF